nr:pentatricopeptide repeat-containing protein, mitochondrial [Quercus suber]
MADLQQMSVQDLYERIRRLADTGKVDRCRAAVEFLITQRKEKPSLRLYTALIMSNISQHLGSAWQAAEYLKEMQVAGIQADTSICHAILKVCSVHPDHLLRTDVMHYMSSRWFQLSEDGARDVVVSMLRDGLFEQAMERLESMSREGMKIPSWLWDMAIYTLCHVGEVEEATRILRQRVDDGEMLISRNVWNTVLDEASSARNHPAVSFVWNHQVNTGYLNPASGICLNVLSTASQAGDAVLGTDVFTQLSKRGTVFQAVHYEQLITCYLSANAPDLRRAISILTIMASEKLEPTAAETRSLYTYLRDKPSQVNEALLHLRSLHKQGRRIPIAALNLLIESYLHQDNLDEAMKTYKLIHTFVPLHDGVQKSFANIDTFNFLLRGCRNGPDAKLASFLVSELLALRITPTALTYDRLILVFIMASSKLIHTDDAVVSRDASSDTLASTQSDAQDPGRRDHGLELLDWSFRHFQDMQSMGWLPRFGTIEKLAVELAAVADERCWDVLQAGEDNADKVEAWANKGKWVRRNVEAAWGKATGSEVGEEEKASAHE